MSAYVINQANRCLYKPNNQPCTRPRFREPRLITPDRIRAGGAVKLFGQDHFPLSALLRSFEGVPRQNIQEAKVIARSTSLYFMYVVMKKISLVCWAEKICFSYST